MFFKTMPEGTPQGKLKTPGAAPRRHQSEGTFTSDEVQQILHFRQACQKVGIMKMGRWKNDSIDRYFSTSSINILLFLLSTKLHIKPGPSSFSPGF